LHWALPGLSAAAPIDTGLAQREVECSATVCEVEGGVQLTFIGTVSEGYPKMPVPGHVAHRLFVMRGPEIDQLGLAVPYNDEHCVSGFARPDLVIMSSGEDGTARIVEPHKKTLKTSFQSIARISYCFDAPSQILLTGYLNPSLPMATVVYDLAAHRVLGELKVAGESTYKPSVLGSSAAIPHLGADGHSWSVMHNTSYSLHPTSIGVEVV